jgi:predicted phosphodiesterase
MKIAILSDLHSNLPALRVVIADIQRWKPDHIVVAGDTINRGPRPGECIDIVLEKQSTQGWRILRGNHEDYVLMHSRSDAPRSGPAFEVHRPSYWTYQRLGATVSDIEAMPSEITFEDPDGGEIQIVHASLIHNRDGIYPETTDQELIRKIGLDERPATHRSLKVFAVGHTHRPLVRSLNGTLIVNAGSAGLPFDQDQRVSYARLLWQNGSWHAEIVRLEYDLAQAEEDFFTTGYMKDSGPLAELVRLELIHASSLLYGWAVQYQSLAMAGKISMRESVDAYLKNLRIAP